MPIKSFGVLINTVDDSTQSHQLYENINQLIMSQYMVSPILFYQNPGKTSVLPQCCQLQQHNAWGFEGTLISTDIESTKVLAQCLRSKKKLFYVYNIEWPNLASLRYSELQKIYQNPEIGLIAKNEEDYRLLTRCWQEPKGIINDYDYKELIKLI
jgi:hypothetical protein